jgi:hypothetical protein
VFEASNGVLSGSRVTSSKCMMNPSKISGYPLFVTAATLLPLVGGDGDRYILMASVLAILVGIWAILGGFA